MTTKVADKKSGQSTANISDNLQMYMESLQFFDDNIDDYIYIYDLAAERVYLTDKIREHFPFPPAGENGNKFSDWNDMVYPKDRKYMDHYRDLLIEGKIDSFDIAYRIMDKKGEKVWVNVKGTMRKKQGEQSMLLVGRITEMRLGRVVDGLTGLFSTVKFMEDLKQELEISDGYLMILGVDNFKNINITQGRASGDNILKSVAEGLDRYAQHPMTIYRLDGDCFAVVFPDKGKKDVMEFYDSIKKEMKDSCTLSAGALSYKKEDKLDVDIIYQYAENALDQAKREGKDRLIFFSADHYQKNLQQVELLDEMRACIYGHKNSGQFYLLYQPQINSRSYMIHGAEALLRYRSPSEENISPVEFIPILEESGLICEVGEWVLKTAIEQCKEWRKKIPDFHISVNISYIQLQQENIADRVLDLVKHAGLPGEALTLEITESIQLQDYPYFNKIFSQWKRYGIKIAIDDFGTGYSSLSYLKSIDVDEVKIDRCFVDRIQCNTYNYQLLSNMIELAHSAQIRVCCEGVETEEEFKALQELDADLQQGFLFAKPCTKENLEECYIRTESKAYKMRKAKEEKWRQMEFGESRELFKQLRKEEIGSIVDGMEEMVYVSDVDTHELYYLNSAGQRMTGVYDYKGCKCYKVLQGLDEPCDFCTNGQLREDEFYVWENENPFLKRHYILKDKLIPWQGRIARLEMAIDITNKEIVSKSIQEKLEFERAIVDACTVLAAQADTENAVYDVIKIMGEFCQSDRVCILKPDKHTGLWDLAWEWCAQGVDSVKKRFPSTFERLVEQVDSKVITAPITRKNHLVGLVCVDNPSYKEDGRNFMKTMAYFLRDSMIDEETQEKINQIIESDYKGIKSYSELELQGIKKLCGDESDSGFDIK